MKDTWFQRLILPGFIFQSMLIGGAYGSGKELVAFFLGSGPIGGLLGMLVTMVAFSAVMAVTFEFARRFKTLNYRAFFKELLGPLWVIFEILYVLLLILIISVAGAAAGQLMFDTFNIPNIYGTLGLIILVGLLVFYGTTAIEKFFTVWSFALYAVYIMFFVWALRDFGGDIAANLTSQPVTLSWLPSGLEYAGYNLAIGAAALFVVRHFKSRGDAIKAGLLAGPIAMFPAMLFFLVMVGQIDAIQSAGDEMLPVTILLNSLSNGGIFAIVFPIILFGTFIETGAGMIHAVNERVAAVYHQGDEEMPQWLRPAIAFGILFTAIVLADAFGLADLISEGYGTITYGFLLIYVLPILTLGVIKLRKAGAGPDG